MPINEIKAPHLLNCVRAIEKLTPFPKRHLPAITDSKELAGILRVIRSYSYSLINCRSFKNTCLYLSKIWRSKKYEMEKYRSGKKRIEVYYLYYYL